MYLYESHKLHLLSHYHYICVALYFSKDPKTFFKVLHSFHYIAGILILADVVFIDRFQFSLNELMVLPTFYSKLHLICMLHEGRD